MVDPSSGGPIDFAALAAALLQRADTLVPQWLPGGKKQGDNWMCGGFDGSAGRSLGVNLRTGAWGEFSGDERGGDLISLYAAIHDINNGQAARRLMAELGWQTAAPAAPAPAPAPAPTPKKPKPEADWRPVVPVPAIAPAPTFKHFHRGVPVATWEYAFEGQRFGYVCRFETSDGGKEILPYTWCEDVSDGRGTQRWHWMQWAAPRPLYVPATLLSGDLSLPVVLVEGEKCALAGHQLLGHEFDFVTWPGGSKAWDRAAWGWLMGRTVYLWPDVDAKRAALSKAERDADVDPATKPLKPEAKQPGMAAMVGIGTRLVREHGCTVFMGPVPKPGEVSDGWDIADAIGQGWTVEQVRGFIRGAHAFVPADEAPAPADDGRSTPSIAGAGKGDREPSWRDELLKSASFATKQVRENVVLALDGLPERGLAGIPEAAGVVAFNEFTNDVVKLADTPWGTKAGVWEETDELELGNWLVHKHWLPSMPRGTLEEAVAMVAKRHRYHPVRADLDRQRGTWDGTERCASWLRRCCLEEDEYDDQAPLQQYLARVGTWVIMAICARVLHPGCKFDYMLILEGSQGVGKSTLARLLGGEFFADTGLVLGDKDSYQNLQGVLVYEWGELDSLSKADVQKVKQFISSAKDRFRASFDRRAKDYPRQVVFVGTTNEDHYLTDPTGNRRMWPVRITAERIDLSWFRANRDQLFAEALSYVEAGQRFYPSVREQRELFDEQQQQRQIENAIEAAVRRYLYDEDQKVTISGDNGTLIAQITTGELLGKLGISVDKQTNVLLRQATAALRHCGWERFRESKRGDRPWMFRRPPRAPWEKPGGSGSSLPAAGSSTRPPAAAGSTQGDDDCPF